MCVPFPSPFGPRRSSPLPSSLQLIHQINEDRKTFTKPSGSNTPVLSIFGPNLLTSDGEDWRRHRRVSVTSFSEKNVEKVWEETGRVVKEWQERLEGEMGERGGVDVQGFENVTAAIAMLVRPLCFPSSLFSHRSPARI